MLALFSARAIILSYVTGFLGPHERTACRSAFSYLKPVAMKAAESPCEQMRTEMLTRVFDMIYSMFWSSRYERDRFPEQFLRMQVVVRQLAAALYEAPAADGSSPGRIGGCLDRLSEEIERLGKTRHTPEIRLGEAMATVRELRGLLERAAEHCTGQTVGEKA